MWLTGERDGPPLAIGAPVAACVEHAGARFEALSAERGSAVHLDWAALLGERAAIAGLHRQGRQSAGGPCRLLATADGWVAVNLARPSDVELVPAWLGVDIDEDEPWTVVAQAVATQPAAAVVDAGQLLGIPVAAVPEPPDATTDEQALARGQRFPPEPTLIRQLVPPSAPPQSTPVVIDLSSLWAGPLCAHLLGLAGARVVKVESTQRPDGARSGPRPFFDLLHAGHESVALDFADHRDRMALHALVAAADVVIEASRPRAFTQLGLVPEKIVASNPHLTWVSITGYGRTGPWANRTAFGDDAAAAAGLVAMSSNGPVFCADAVADPISGIYAATAALSALAHGGGAIIDVALREAAGHVTHPDGPRRRHDVEAQGGDECGWAMVTENGPVAVEAPRARTPAGTAAPSGTHTEAVLRDLGIRR